MSGSPPSDPSASDPTPTQQTPDVPAPPAPGATQPGAQTGEAPAGGATGPTGAAAGDGAAGAAAAQAAKAAQQSEKERRNREAERTFNALLVPQNAAPEDGPRQVLHVGCGPPLARKLHVVFRTPEWREIRVDIDPAARPDIIASITDLSTVADASADAVWSSHNVEHLFAHEVPIAFAEFLRVLRPGGFFLVTLPDLQTVAAEIAKGRLEEPLYQSPGGPISPLDIVFGFRKSIARGNHYMQHRTGFSAQTLGRHMHRAGFRDIRARRDLAYNLWAVGFKPVAAPAEPEAPPADSEAAAGKGDAAP